MPFPLIVPAVTFGIGATLGGNRLLDIFRGEQTQTTSSNVSSAVRTIALSGVAVVAIIAVTKAVKK